MTVTALTVNTNTYFSYASVAEATIRLAIDPIRGPVWNALAPVDQNIHLVAATRRVDEHQFVGDIAVAGQPLQWPRINAVVNGITLPDDEVPTAIEDATILFAATGAADPTHYQTIRISNSNIKREQLDDLITEYFNPIQVIETQDTRIIRDDDVERLLQPYLAFVPETAAVPGPSNAGQLGGGTQVFRRTFGQSELAYDDSRNSAF